MLQNLTILKDILNLIFYDRYHSCRTYLNLKEVVFNGGHLEFSDFKNVHHRLITNYALVSREWFTLVSKLCRNYFIHFMVFENHNDRLSNNQYSLYNYKNITHLYIDHLTSSSSLSDQNNNSFKSFLMKFTSLERITFSSYEDIFITPLYRDIVNIHPTIKLNIYIYLQSLCRDTLWNPLETCIYCLIHTIISLKLFLNDDFELYERYRGLSFEEIDEKKMTTSEEFASSLSKSTNSTLKSITLNQDCFYSSCLISALKSSTRFRYSDSNQPFSIIYLN